MKKLLIGSVAASGLMAGGAWAAEKIVVVTSFPEEMTAVIEKAFEGAHPEYDIEILNKSTSSGVKYVQEIASANTADIFWASAPDAFEVLKSDGKLVGKITQCDRHRREDRLLSDERCRWALFRLRGLGLRDHVERPAIWKATSCSQRRNGPIWRSRNISAMSAMSAPSRSGTTHLTVETVLQGEGWDKGWADWKWMGGNFALGDGAQLRRAGRGEHRQLRLRHRDRLLRLLVQGLGLPGGVRLSDGDRAGACQRRRHRQCAE
jgi:phosphoglycerate transport regulatory protein PgtC